jgi:uncharacterized 2Fe-2S/4Fe-4S cluster protein (DUF4445 family)
MTEHTVHFEYIQHAVKVPTGTLLSEAARLAGVEIGQPCGGQGRCGRCIVQVTDGTVRSRSTLRLSEEDQLQGYTLACQSIVESDVYISVPPQEKVERCLVSDRTAREVSVPDGYHPISDQTIRRVYLTLPSPSMEDQTDDLSRLKAALRQQAGFHEMRISTNLLRKLGKVLRSSNWQINVILDTHAWDAPADPPRLVDIRPGFTSETEPIWGAAIDIGTTTVTLWLVDLVSGQVRAQTAEYNQQILRGEDVISRIIFASKNGGDEILRQLVLTTINGLVAQACKRVLVEPDQVVKATVTGNTTMMHLLLGIPADSIRLSPFIPTVNHIPLMRAAEVGLEINPDAVVDCLPGVASYVGADITAGVLSSGLDDTERVCLFMDVGTNGEIVLGSREWQVTCACSAGPAFEGAGVQDGMRATKGAIEEVWINQETYAPYFRVIGGTKPTGICGSGLISLLAELFLTGVVDKAGNVNLDLPTNRVRNGPHGAEYVVAWGSETQHGRDLVITRVDIDNLLRAKAAIYAGFTILADSIGYPLESVEQVLIGGSFGKYINVEKAIQIGLLPDLPWERFRFLGNTAVMGAYLALLDRKVRARLKGIAARMTYIELSADNTFYEAFTSALFLPHTDQTRFPRVAEALVEIEEKRKQLCTS